MTESPKHDREYLERLEFARGHVLPGSEPVEPRPAATVISGRTSSEGGFEVLLLKRPEESRFAAGVFVFAGGVVDEADGLETVRAVLPPAHRGEESGALAAGLRELFEETGYLLSDERTADHALEKARASLLADEICFADLVTEFGLTFLKLRVAYIARWITPINLSRRYDARFFLTEAPDIDPTLTEELTDFVWLSPAEAVARFEAGSLPMLFPTRVTLERLSEFADLDSAFEAYRNEEIEPVLPRLLVRGDRIIPAMPGDPAFDEDPEPGPAS